MMFDEHYFTKIGFSEKHALRILTRRLPVTPHGTLPQHPNQAYPSRTDRNVRPFTRCHHRRQILPVTEIIDKYLTGLFASYRRFFAIRHARLTLKMLTGLATWRITGIVKRGGAGRLELLPPHFDAICAIEADARS